jgi:O-methyltransferase involved in polyketide biosynthesis
VVDNGQVHWIDMDLPDSIELRRRFFVEPDRRLMLAAPPAIVTPGP